MLPILAVSSDLREWESPPQTRPPPAPCDANAAGVGLGSGQANAAAHPRGVGDRNGDPDPLRGVAGRGSLDSAEDVAMGRRRGSGSRSRRSEGEEGEGRERGGDGYATPPPPALTVSGRWILEPLHGRGPRRRRRSSASASSVAPGCEADREGVEHAGERAPGTAGEVGVGLVKRSLDIRMGKLELWPDPPLLGRVSHLIRSVGRIGLWCDLAPLRLSPPLRLSLVAMCDDC